MCTVNCSTNFLQNILFWRSDEIFKWWNVYLFFWGGDYPFQGHLLCKIHFYLLFEHKCVLAVCVQNQPEMISVGGNALQVTRVT